MSIPINELAESLIASGVLTVPTYKLWYERLFGPALPNGGAPWDPWLDKEWRKESRTSFAEIAAYYDDDAFVCFQVGQSGGWDGATLGQLEGLVRPGSTVLDYGCGHGNVGVACAKVGAVVTFSDVSRRLLTGIDRVCAQHQSTVLIRQITIEVPLWPTNTFDLVIATDVLEHVQKPIEVLHELVASLRIGGHLLVTVFFGGHELSPYHLSENYKYGDPEIWAKICIDAGLEVVPGLDRVYKRVR